MWSARRLCHRMIYYSSLFPYFLWASHNNSDLLRRPPSPAGAGPARSPQSSTCHYRRYTSEGGEMSTVRELAVSPPPRDAAAATCPRHRTVNTRNSHPGPCGVPSAAQRRPQDRGARGERAAGPAAAFRTPQRTARPGGCLSRPPLPPAQTGPAPLPPTPSPPRLPPPRSPQCPHSRPKPPSRPGGRRSHLGGVVRAGPGPLARFSRAAAVPIQNGGWGRALAPRPFPSPALSRGGDAGGAEGRDARGAAAPPRRGLRPIRARGRLRAGQSAPCDLGGAHPAALRAEPQPRAIGREGLKSFLPSQPIRAP